MSSQDIPLPSFSRQAAARFCGGALAPGEIAAAFAHTLHTNKDQRVAVASRSKDRAVDSVVTLGSARPMILMNNSLVTTTWILSIAAPHSEHRKLTFWQSLPETMSWSRNHLLLPAPGGQLPDMVHAARQAGVFAMEAMWTRYVPNGNHPTIAGRRCSRWRISCDRRPSVRSPTMQIPGGGIHPLGGGALLDLGVYPISFASFVLGAPALVAVGSTSASGVDAQACLILVDFAQQRTMAAGTHPVRHPRWLQFPGHLGTSALTAH